MNIAQRLCDDEADVSSDPFYSEANMKHLENIMEKVRNGTAHFEEHELIEVEDE